MVLFMYTRINKHIIYIELLTCGEDTYCLPVKSKVNRKDESVFFAIHEMINNTESSQTDIKLKPNKQQ